MSPATFQQPPINQTKKKNNSAPTLEQIDQLELVGDQRDDVYIGPMIALLKSGTKIEKPIHRRTNTLIQERDSL